jgi:hypothetical protein
MGSQYRVPYYLSEHKHGAISKQEAARRVQRHSAREGEPAHPQHPSAATPVKAAGTPPKTIPAKKSEEGGAATRSSLLGGVSALFSSHRASSREETKGGLGPASPSVGKTPTASPKAAASASPSAAPGAAAPSASPSAGPSAAAPSAGPGAAAGAAPSAGPGAAAPNPKQEAGPHSNGEPSPASLVASEGPLDAASAAAEETTEDDATLEASTDHDETASSTEDEEENEPYASEETLRRALHAHCMKRKDLSPEADLCLRNMLDAHRRKPIKWYKRPQRFLGSLNRPKTDLCNFDVCELSALSQQRAIRQEPAEDGEVRLVVDDPAVCSDVSRAGIHEEDSCAGVTNLSLELIEFSAGKLVFLTRHVLTLLRSILDYTPSLIAVNILKASAASMSKIYAFISGKKAPFSRLSERDLQELQMKIIEGSDHNIRLALKDISSKDARKNEIDSSLLTRVKHGAARFSPAMRALTPVIDSFLLKILPSLVNVYGGGVDAALTYVSILLPKWELDGCKVGKYEVKGWYVFIPSIALSIFLGYFTQAIFFKLLALGGAVRGGSSLLSVAVQDKFKDFNVETNSLLTTLVEHTRTFLMWIRDGTEVSNAWIRARLCNSAIAYFFVVLSENFGKLYTSLIEMSKDAYDAFKSVVSVAVPGTRLFGDKGFSFSSETSSTYLEKALYPFQEATPTEKAVTAGLEDISEQVKDSFRWIGGKLGWDVKGQITKLERRTLDSEAIASFAQRLANTWRKINQVALQNKELHDFDEWVTSFLRTFTTSFYHFLFECISDFLLCIVAQIFWRMRNDRQN